MIIGTVLGCVVAISLIIVWLIILRRRAKRTTNQAANGRLETTPGDNVIPESSTKSEDPRDLSEMPVVERPGELVDGRQWLELAAVERPAELAVDQER